MDKEELMECIDQLYLFGKKLIVMWNGYSMEQIRLNCANLRRIEEHKQHSKIEIDKMKFERYKNQQETNYWRYKKLQDEKKDKDQR